MRSILKYIDEALFSSASEFSKADDIDEDFVDLGLSVNWAKCNLGADSETDIGHYYMWGSTVPNDNDICSWETVPFNNGHKYFDKDYFNSVKNKVCPNGILASEYDAAYKESDGDYRMPTNEECEELIKKTKHKYVINYNDTGINGCIFANKNDESKYIFVPISGCRLGNSMMSTGKGFLPSSSLDIKHPYYVYYINLYTYTIEADYCIRAVAMSIRPVQEK